MAFWKNYFEENGKIQFNFCNRYLIKFIKLWELTGQYSKNLVACSSNVNQL